MRYSDQIDYLYGCNSRYTNGMKDFAKGFAKNVKSATAGARGAMRAEVNVAKDIFKDNGGGLKGAAKVAKGYGNLAKHTAKMKGASALNFAKHNPGKVALGAAAVAAASAALIGAYKLHNIKRDGELYAYYTTSNGGTVTEKKIATISKSMSGDEVENLINKTKAELKEKGATKIKLRVVYDKSRLAQLKENMSNLFKKKSNSREVINSRCLDIYGGINY